jgi:hypothetical protein
MLNDSKMFADILPVFNSIYKKLHTITNYNKRLVEAIRSGLVLKVILSDTQALQLFTINLKRGVFTIFTMLLKMPS